MSKKFINPMDYIYPINVNGLESRYLFIPSQLKKNKSNVLIVYDIDFNLEKWFGYLTALSKFSNVYMIDLPGLGGADNFYKIGLKPELGNMANYLSSIIKLKFRRQNLSVIGIGYGFTLITKMIQNDLEIEKKINNVVAINGYVHFEDFNFDRSYKIKVYLNYFISKNKFLAQLVSLVIKSDYYLIRKYDDDYFKKFLNSKFPFLKQFAIDLDKSRDFRTESTIKYNILKLDLCSGRKIDKPLWAINTVMNKKVIYKRVEQHLKVIYSNYNYLNLPIRKMPFLINNQKFGLRLIPHKLKAVLKKYT